jgi:hypothetical protein
LVAIIEQQTHKQGQNKMTNTEWENKVATCCENVLKDGTDKKLYAQYILDSMYYNNQYQSPDGTNYYFEISKFDTISGNPFVIS